MHLKVQITNSLFSPNQTPANLRKIHVCPLSLAQINVQTFFERINKILIAIQMIHLKYLERVTLTKL